MISTLLSGALLALAPSLLAAGVVGAHPETTQQVSTNLTLEVRAGATITKTTLDCYPSVGGSHPEAKGACADLRRTRGNFDLLPVDSQTVCPSVYAPVVATIKGTWCGKEVSWSREFSNSCVLRTSTGSVFSFQG